MKLMNSGFVGGKCPPIYTLDEVKLPVESLLKRISQAAGILSTYLYFTIIFKNSLIYCIFGSNKM